MENPNLVNSDMQSRAFHADCNWKKTSGGSTCLFFLLLLLAVGFTNGAPAKDNGREVTLLFTNDFESAFDPIPAYWRDDVEYLGGIAQIATLVETIRDRETLVFLFDAGDIFTGILSKLTEGAVPMEMMITMGYDAMAIGNHEFEYGWESFADQKSRLPFPVLGANLFYKGTDHPYAQPYAVIERDGFRIGVIGILGRDARNAIIPSHVAGVDFREPIPIVKGLVNELRPAVDLIVVLAHQGKTAPMQTDDEAHPDIQRGIEADYNKAGEVEGIDVLFCGHADAGTEKPVVHPKTGTLIMQTYGQGTRLGYLKLQVAMDTGAILSHQGSLLHVVSNELKPHPMIVQKLEHYRALFPDLQKTIFHAKERFSRVYNKESDLGNLYADILREEGEAQIGFIHAGGLRKDLPKGDVPLADLMNSFPFKNEMVILEMNGAQIKEVLEQSLTLERGMLQVSGLNVEYDLDRPIGGRTLSISVGNEILDPRAAYRVATTDFLAQGGDHYSTFPQTKRLTKKGSQPLFAEALQDYLSAQEVVEMPSRGRLIPIASK